MRVWAAIKRPQTGASIRVYEKLFHSPRKLLELALVFGILSYPVEEPGID